MTDDKFWRYLAVRLRFELERLDYELGEYEAEAKRK